MFSKIWFVAIVFEKALTRSESVKSIDLERMH